MSVCPIERHEEMKRDPLAWTELELRGVQRGDVGDPVYEVRNCACGSTLYLELPAAESVAP